MAAKSASSGKPLDEYLHKTQRPLYSLWFVMPLVMLSQVSMAWSGQVLWAPHWMERVLRHFGATAAYLPALLIVAVLVMQHLVRKDPFECRLGVLAGMLVESVLWTLPLIALRLLVAMTLSTSPSAGGGLWLAIGEKVAAGLFEEFLFRLFLFTVSVLVFVDVFELKKAVVLPPTVVVSAVLFALAHFSGDQLRGLTHLPWSNFMFFAGAGALLGCVFLLRGFGVAVGAHCAYNLFVCFTAR